MIWRNNLSWKTYLYKQNKFYVWNNSFRGELVLLLVETNVNLVFLYDNEFNKLTFETFEKRGMLHKMNYFLWFVGTQIKS